MSDLIQRAAAICGIDNPNSDQLAAWLDSKPASYTIGHDHTVHTGYNKLCIVGTKAVAASLRLIECLAAAVVEVDRIEREAKT